LGAIESTGYSQHADGAEDDGGPSIDAMQELLLYVLNFSSRRQGQDSRAHAVVSKSTETRTCRKLLVAFPYYVSENSFFFLEYAKGLRIFVLSRSRFFTKAPRRWRRRFYRWYKDITLPAHDMLTTPELDNLSSEPRLVSRDL
jgi:hypothetical protein